MGGSGQVQSGVSRFTLGGMTHVKSSYLKLDVMDKLGRNLKCPPWAILHFYFPINCLFYLIYFQLFPPPPSTTVYGFAEYHPKQGKPPPEM
jgi:hypothetical protein